MWRRRDAGTLAEVCQTDGSACASARERSNARHLSRACFVRLAAPRSASGCNVRLRVDTSLAHRRLIPLPGIFRHAMHPAGRNASARRREWSTMHALLIADCHDAVS